MHTQQILNEVRQLYNVSDRLDALAGQPPLVSEALITISGSVRNTATLLGVLVATKMTLLSGLDPANACRLIAAVDELAFRVDGGGS
jgi:hypothetical protein